MLLTVPESRAERNKKWLFFEQHGTPALQSENWRSSVFLALIRNVWAAGKEAAAS